MRSMTKLIGIEDIMVIAGIGAVSAGAWMVHEPSGYIVGGLFSLAIGLLIGRAKAAKKVEKQ